MARLQVGWALSLSRTQLHSDISVVEKVAIVLKTEKGERDAYELITKKKANEIVVSSTLAIDGNGAAPLVGIYPSSSIQNEASPVAGMSFPQESHH